MIHSNVYHFQPFLDDSLALQSLCVKRDVVVPPSSSCSCSSSLSPPPPPPLFLSSPALPTLLLPRNTPPEKIKTI